MAGTSSAVRIATTPSIASASEASIESTRACGIGLVQSRQKSIPSARKSSAYLAWPVTLATMSGGVKSLPISVYVSCCAMSGLPCELGGTHDAAQVVVVGSAAAEIAGHRE